MIEYQHDHIIFESHDGSYKFGLDRLTTLPPLLQLARDEQETLGVIHLDLTVRDCKRLLHYYKDGRRFRLGIVGHQLLKDDMAEVKSLLQRIGRFDDSPCYVTYGYQFLDYFHPKDGDDVRTDHPDYLAVEELW